MKLLKKILYTQRDGRCAKCNSFETLFSPDKDGGATGQCTTSDYRWRNICLDCSKVEYKNYRIKIYPNV